MPLRSTFTRFFQLEAASGLLLIAAAALALIVNNSPLSHYYTAFLDVPVAVQIGALQIAKPSLLWINDGLMALFFLLIGLEVKRELLEGQLSKPSQVVLRWAVQQGAVVIPASQHRQRWLSNADLFSFELTDQEMIDLATIDLGEADLTGVDEVVIRAVAADITVAVPGQVGELSSDLTLSSLAADPDVETDTGVTVLDRLVIDATASDVKVVRGK